MKDRNKMMMRMKSLPNVLTNFATFHMFAGLLLFGIVLSPSVSWSCSKGDFACAIPLCVWDLKAVFVNSKLARVVPLMEILACALTIASISAISLRWKTAFAVFNALTFLVSIFPWTIVFGFSERSRESFGPGLWFSILSSFVVMLAACMSMIAIFNEGPEMVEKINEDFESSGVQSLIPRTALKANSDCLMHVMELFADTALLAALWSLMTLYAEGDGYDSLGAKGCQIAVVLVAMDVAILARYVCRKDIDVGMGSIVASSLALVGWITGIVGCSLTAAALGSFEMSSLLSLIAVLSLFVVFILGIYIGVRY